MVSSDEPSKRGTNPEQISTYFRSSILVLSNSLAASSSLTEPHDLSEAYNLFANRVKAIAHTFHDSNQKLPSLNYLSQHSAIIYQCLSRDIRRAFNNPFPLTPPHDPVYPTDEDPLASSEMIQYARNDSTICHHALQLLSNVFRIPALSALFTPNDLSSLLDDVLDLATVQSLPSLHEQRTIGLARWVLTTLHLPVPALSSRTSRLCVSLRKIIDHKDSHVDVLDGLKAIQNLMRRHPTVFLRPFAELLPSIFVNLSHPSVAVRSQAAYTLGRYTHALVYDVPADEDLKNVLRQHTRMFVAAATKKDASPRLSDILSSPLQSSRPPIDPASVAWPFVAIACIVVFSGAHYFTHSHTVKFVVAILGRSAEHKSIFVQRLHARVWKCLVWAYANIQTEPELASDSADTKTTKTPVETRHNAFMFVKQNHRGGVGLAFASSLLLTSGTADDHATLVARAIQVVLEMVEDVNDAVHAQGRAALTRMISHIGTSTTSPSSLISARDRLSFVKELLPKELFDGTILEAKEGAETDAISVDAVRHLSEDEVIHHWDGLLDIWRICVDRMDMTVNIVFPLSDDLLHSWQALLLVQAQLTQGHQHLSAPPEFAHRVRTIITDLLQSNPKHNDAGASSSRILCLVTQLWRVVTNTFTTSWLSSIADSVLAAVNNQRYDLTSPEVKQVWADFCASLIMVDPADLLRKLQVDDKRQNMIELQRHVWARCAKTYHIQTPRSWRDSLSFLTVPFGLWTLSEQEIQSWTAVMETIFETAAKNSEPPNKVLQAFASLVADQHTRYFYPQIIQMLLRRVCLDENVKTPTKFFMLVNNILVGLYGAGLGFSSAVETLHAVSDMITRCPMSRIISLVACLSHGLSTWICDQQELLTVEDYNQEIMCIYNDILDALRGCSFDADSLVLLEPFFSSAFSRIPAPALGPMAFKSFWSAVYPSFQHLNVPIPVGIKEILKVLHEVFGGTLTWDVSFDSESQLESQLESQPPSRARSVCSETQEYSFVPETPPEVIETGTSHMRTSAFLSSCSAQPSALTGEPRSPPLIDYPDPSYAATMGVYHDHDSPGPPRWAPQLSSHSGKTRAMSVILSPQAPFLQGEEEVPPRESAQKLGESCSIVPSSLDSSSSVFLPSSPTTGKRKYREVALESRNPARPASLKVRQSDLLTTKGAAALSHASKRSFKESRYYSADVDLPPDQQSKRQRLVLSTNLPKSHSLSASRLLSPEVLYEEPMSPVERYSSLPPSDDYETWETGIDSEELRHALPDTGRDNDKSYVEPSSSQLAEDELLTPHMRSRITLRARSAPGDLLHADHSPDDDSGNPHPGHITPTPSPRKAPPLRRSRATSSRLDTLQRAMDLIREGGTEMEIEEVLRASKMVHEMDGLLKETLVRRLGSGDQIDVDTSRQSPRRGTNDRGALPAPHPPSI